jgi:competence protein ComEC
VAFLASTPSGIGYFQTLSPGSLVANLIIMPISSFALVAGFLALLTGLVGLDTWSMLFNSAAALILIVMDWLVQQGIAWPGMYYNAQFVVSWLAPASLVGMTTVMLAGLAGKWSPRYGGFWPPVLLLTLLLLFGVHFD